MKKKRSNSTIWNLPSDKFQSIIDLSDSYSQICRHLGIRPLSGNIQTVQLRIKNQECSLIQFEKNVQIRRSNNAVHSNLKKKTPIDQIFCQNSSYRSNAQIKKLMVETFEVKNCCSECGQEPFFNHKPLSLQLDHINGINDDNRIENLRLLCPNCHSQTETFCNKKIYRCSCGEKIFRKSTLCRKCFSQSRKNTNCKIEWPEPHELQKLLWEKPTSQIAKELGVSDNAVGKFAKKFSLSKPPRGFWQKNGPN